MSTPEVFVATPEYAVGLAHRVLIFVTRTRPDTNTLVRVRAELERQAGKDLLGYLQVVSPRTEVASANSESTRKAWVALGQTAFDTARVGAVVIASQGFASTILRSSVTATLLLLKGRRPVRVFGATGEAAAWMASELRGVPGAPGGHELSDAADAVFKRTEG